MSMIIVVVLIILIIFLFYPLKIRVIRNSYLNDVKLYLIKSINLAIDLDEFVRIISKDNQNSPMIINIIKINKTKNFIKTVLNFSKIKKITVIMNKDISFEEGKVFFNVSSWIAISYFRNFICNNFKYIKNEYYAVRNETVLSKTVNIDIIFEIRMVYFLFSLFLNIKEIPQLFKVIKKGSDKDEQSSNIWTIKYFNE